jgi:hypothetical protein
VTQGGEQQEAAQIMAGKRTQDKAITPIRHTFLSACVSTSGALPPPPRREYNNDDELK